MGGPSAIAHGDLNQAGDASGQRRGDSRSLRESTRCDVDSDMRIATRMDSAFECDGCSQNFKKDN